jgi:hypothetical protein
MFRYVNNNASHDYVNFHSSQIDYVAQTQVNSSISQNNPFIIEATSAFFGALFPVLFTIVGYIFKKAYDRATKHYNALIHYEALLNDHIGAIQDNIYLIDNFIKAIESGKIYWSRIKPIESDKFNLKSLYNLTLINDLNNYFYTILRLSDDIEGISLAYQELKEALINKHIDPATYILNSREISRNLILLKAFLEKSNEETIDLLCKIRLTLKKDRTKTMKFMGKVVELFMSKSSEVYNEDEIKNEKKKLNQEIKKSREVSSKKINEVEKKLK